MVESLGGALLGLVQGILIVGIAIQLCLMFPLSPGLKEMFSSSTSKKISVPTLTKSYLSIFGMFPRVEFVQQKIQVLQEQVVPAIPSQENIQAVPKTKSKTPKL